MARHGRSGEPARHSTARPRERGDVAWIRYVAMSVPLLAGAALIVFAGAWRGFEAIVSAHAIHLVTGQETVANPGRHLLILYKSTSVQQTFVLTGECTVAYLLGALLIGAAPLMLLRRLSRVRTSLAIAVAAAVLIAVNVVRLTVIGATVSEWGRDPGLTIAHTYLGSVLTILGTGGAGLAFVAVLLRRRAPGTPDVG